MYVGRLLKMKKILALTSIRSEYDLMSGVYKLLHTDADVDLQLLVSGAHLSPSHGLTVTDIYADRLNVLMEVETLLSADSASSRLKTASNLLAGSIDAVKKFAPDVIVYAGDREDVLVGGMLGGYLGIPTAHFFSGDHASDGHIDNPVRHATSKLSSTHFVSIAEHRDRLLSIGEPENRVFVIGSVALDKFRLEPPVKISTVLGRMNAKEHAYTAPIAILIFHPLESERGVAGEFIQNAAHALVEAGFHVCIGMPNTDPGNFSLFQSIDALSDMNEVTFYGNLARNDFVNLFRNASLIVGNSSAGILEAATLKIPAINIGLRQRGRTCGENVIFCDGDFNSITAAVQTVTRDGFQAKLRSVTNSYGDGHSTELAAKLLKSVDFSEFLRKPEDPLHAHRLS